MNRTFTLQDTNAQNLFKTLQALPEEQAEKVRDVLQIRKNTWHECIHELKRNTCYYALKHLIMINAVRIVNITDITLEAIGEGIRGI